MICRAKGCKCERMPDSYFCGRHDEMAEDGEPFELKPKRTNPNNFTMEEKAQKWIDTRERERLHKRKSHPEWREKTRRLGAQSIEELAAMYDARRARDQAYKDTQLKYADKETRRSAVKDAVYEVLDEIKAKRVERSLNATQSV